MLSVTKMTRIAELEGERGTLTPQGIQEATLDNSASCVKKLYAGGEPRSLYLRLEEAGQSCTGEVWRGHF